MGLFMDTHFKMMLLSMENGVSVDRIQSKLLINGIKMILGIEIPGIESEQTDALNVLENALDVLLDNADINTFNRYKGSGIFGKVEFNYESKSNQDASILDSELTDEEQGIVNKAKSDGTYLKAPNGKDTKLTPKQWVQVRTKAFKEWFGDWEKAFKKNFLLSSEPVASLTGNEFSRVEGKTLTDLVENYFNSIGNKAISPLYGEVILDKDGAEDSLAHGMGRKKAIAYAAVKDVIENGILLDYDADHKNRGYDTALIAAPIIINDTYYICGVVIKRNLTDNKFYLHEVLEQEWLSDEGSNTAQKQPQHPKAFAKVYENLKYANDNASKVVDENGEPKVVFHGSSFRPLSEDGVFTPNDGALGKGIYFTSAFPEAADYAREKLGDTELSEDEIYDNGYITEAFLNITDTDNIIPSHYGNGEYIYLAENPNQIKSATDNTGEFSAENDDIRYRLADRPMGARLHSEEVMLESIDKMSDTFGVKAEYVYDAKNTNKKGWYDPKDGKVYVNLSAHETIADAKATYLHEVVGHFGLRGLLKDKFEEVMNNVFNSLLKDVQTELLGKYRNNKEIAAEEYLSGMIENDIEPSLVNRILGYIREALRSMGINLDHYTNGDLEYLLWRSKNNLRERMRDL